MTFSRIAGTGGYLPARIVTNRDLEQTVDTSDKWIFSRTGIRERHVAADDELASDLALHASRRALEAAGLKATDLDLIIVATTTPDVIFPSTACILQKKLSARACAAFDVQAVCSGFVYALATADLFIRAGKCHHALVVGTEIYSRILDWTDRGTCVLFGDGAGAVVIASSDAPGILSTHLHADGSYHDILAVPGQVSGGKIRGRPFVVMEGGTVFKFAVKVLARGRARGLEGEWARHRRYQLADHASGQHSHHRGDSEEARAAPGAGRFDRGTPREHLGCFDSPCTG